MLSYREGDVSAHCTRGRRAVLFPLPTCVTASSVMIQSCSLCEVLCQLRMAALVSVLVGEASPALVLLRQECGTALLVLSVDRRVTAVSLSMQSKCMKVISELCPGEPGKNTFARERYGFISLFLSPVLPLAVCWG